MEKGNSDNPFQSSKVESDAREHSVLGRIFSQSVLVCLMIGQAFLWTAVGIVILVVLYRIGRPLYYSAFKNTKVILINGYYYDFVIRPCMNAIGLSVVAIFIGWIRRRIEHARIS